MIKLPLIVLPNCREYGKSSLDFLSRSSIRASQGITECYTHVKVQRIVIRVLAIGIAATGAVLAFITGQGIIYGTFAMFSLLHFHIASILKDYEDPVEVKAICEEESHRNNSTTFYRDLYKSSFCIMPKWSSLEGGYGSDFSSPRLTTIEREVTRLGNKVEREIDRVYADRIARAKNFREKIALEQERDLVGLRARRNAEAKKRARLSENTP